MDEVREKGRARRPVCPLNLRAEALIFWEVREQRKFQAYEQYLNGEAVCELERSEGIAKKDLEEPPHFHGPVSGFVLSMKQQLAD